MIENTRSLDLTANLVLLAGVAFILAPLALALITATQSHDQFIAAGGFSLTLGDQFFVNLRRIVEETALPWQLMNSIIIATLVAFMKTWFCFLATAALVFFKSRWSGVLFAVMIASVMLPPDLRVITVYQVVSNVLAPMAWMLEGMGVAWLLSLIGAPAPELRLNLLDTWFGVAGPLAANATAVFIFRQFFLTLPRDLARAAVMDGAGPGRFIVDILAPLSRTPLIATFMFFFIGGWCEYLWPLVAASTPSAQTAVVGLAKLAVSDPDEVPDTPLIMAGVIFISVIPVTIIAVMQRHIVRGLTLSEK